MSHKKQTSLFLAVACLAAAAAAAEGPKKRTIVSTPTGYQSAASSYPQAAINYPQAAINYPQAASYSPAASGFYASGFPQAASAFQTSYPQAFGQAASAYAFNPSQAAGGYNLGFPAQAYSSYPYLQGFQGAFQPFEAQKSFAQAPAYGFRQSSAAYLRPAAAQQSLQGYAGDLAAYSGSAGLNAASAYSLQPQFQPQPRIQPQQFQPQAARVGPATFGTHGGGRQATAASNQVNNGGYGFVRPY
ncbi:prisilkin-39-like [Cloeon dipterum]|uniref:prisilkin-39-like n=1 Tax=Cloeon dipterum TaxID=197152 RepID=UPI00321F742A